MIGRVVTPSDYGRVMGRTKVSAVVCVLSVSLTACTAGDGMTRSSGATGSHPQQARESSVGVMALTLGEPRAVHRATLLDDGRVLITGGCTAPGCGGFDAGRASEFFDLTNDQFDSGPSMRVARASGTATSLNDGRVLLTGGYPGEGEAPTGTAELFDPATDTFISTGSMTTPRADHTATLLPDGRVMLCGGYGAGGAALRSTEVFDPATGLFAAGPEMTSPRAGQAAVEVGGRIVLIGGTISGHALATTEVYDGTSWSPGPELAVARVKHGAVTLPDRRILVVGGASSTEGRKRFDSTELINLHSGHVSAGPRLSHGEYKLDGAVVELPDGRVVIAGGRRVNVFDPQSDTISVLTRPVGPQLAFLSATVVAPRLVLIAGGYDRNIVPTSRAVLVNIPRSRGG